MNKPLTIQILVVVEPDGQGFHAYCPALKGLHIDGSTQLEALERAREAISVYLDSLALHGDPVPVGPHLKIDLERPQPIPTGALVHSLNIPWPILATSGIS